MIVQCMLKRLWLIHGPSRKLVDHIASETSFSYKKVLTYQVRKRQHVQHSMCDHMSSCNEVTDSERTLCKLWPICVVFLPVSAWTANLNAGHEVGRKSCDCFAWRNGWLGYSRRSADSSHHLCKFQGERGVC